VPADREGERADYALAAKHGCLTRDELRAFAGLRPLGAAAGGNELVGPAPAGDGEKRARRRRPASRSRIVLPGQGGNGNGQAGG